MPESKSVKQRGEDAAAAYLERAGIAVIERRWQSDAGRIDVLAWEGDQLVLVDIKTRQAGQSPVNQPMSTATKRRIERIAKACLNYADPHDKTWRYDRIQLLVISEDRALLRHHRDALTTGI